jgi:DNA-binding MarR family transcriptional regulator
MKADGVAGLPPLELAGFVPYRLSVLANRVSRQLAALYAERFGISIAEWRAIAVLGLHSEVSADFVSRMTDMDRVTVSRALARLLGKRLITRRTDRSDRRCSVLRLSAGGRRVYAEIVPLARNYERTLLAALGEPERAVLERALRALEAGTTALESGSGGG